MCPQLSAASDAGFLGRVGAAIDENLSYENFHVDTLARMLAVSRSLLYLRLGGSGPPAKLILERRLLRAAALLSDGVGS